MKKLLITLLFGLTSHALSTEESTFGGIVASKEEETKILKCAFIVKDYAGGAPNEATCAMSPHEVFGNKWFTPKKSDHCDVSDTFEDFFFVEELKDFHAHMLFSEDSEFIGGKVLFDREFGPNHVFIEAEKEKAIREGNDPKEIEKKFKKTSTRSFFDIDNVTIQETLVGHDLITKEFLSFKDQYKMPVYVIQFDNRSLYYSETSPEATIVSYENSGGNSWIKQKFGTCGFL